MGRTVTCGRYPSLGEVLAYYGRGDFLDFLLRTCEVRRVFLVMPRQGHWEPDREHGVITAGSRAELWDLVCGRILSEHAKVPVEARLPFYPSFHQSLERWSPGEVGASGRAGRDTVLESDQPTWRASFRDVATLLDVLREEEVPHLLKFSGHRSLHVLLPCAQVAIHAGTFGDSRAHPAGLLRMPYSLNEDTGLVSLPLRPEEVVTFRPWQANLHLVRIREDWLREPSEEERARVRSFVAESRRREPVPRRSPVEPAQVRDELRAVAARLRAQVDGLDKTCRRLLGDPPITGEQLVQALRSPDAEVRWPAAEAFLVHGDDLPREAVGALLADTDPYVHAAAVDVLARFADTAEAHFAEAMQAEEMGGEVRALSVLAESAVLRDRVVSGLRADRRHWGPLVTRLASVTGAVLDDWPAAWEMLRSAEAHGATGPHWEMRVQALRLLATVVEDRWGPALDFQAVQAAADLGPVITDLLLLAMGTPDRRRRRAFLIALSLIGDVRALDIYIEALADTYRDNPRWATRALVEIGAPAVPALLEAAQSDEPRVRRYAIRCLGHLRDPRARDTILEALTDPDQAIRGQAVLAMRHYLREEDVPALKEVMRHSRAETRTQARDLLLSLGEAGTQALRALALEDGEPTAAGWLWEQGDARGREAVLAAAEHDSSGWEAAVIELARRPLDDETLPLLVRALPRAEWATQEAVARALVESRSPDALAALLALAQSEDLVDRKVAAIALAAWGDRRATEALVGLLADPRRSVRQQAVAALLRAGERAREALEAAEQGARRAPARRYLREVLTSLEVRRRLAAGDRLNRELLEMVAQTPTPIWAEAGACLGARADREELEVLLEACVQGATIVRWVATNLLAKMGPTAREAVEARLHSAEGTAREKLRGVLEHIDREAEGRED